MSYRLLLMGLALLTIGGCGDNSQPLVSGAVTGVFKGTSFQAMFGFAKARPGTTSLIGLGAGPLNCDSADAASPPTGLNGLIEISALTVNNYAGVSVSVLSNNNGSGFDFFSSSDGTVDITTAATSTISGSVTYNATDSGNSYALNGSFIVVRCP